MKFYSKVVLFLTCVTIWAFLFVFIADVLSSGTDAVAFVVNIEPIPESEAQAETVQICVETETETIAETEAETEQAFYDDLELLAYCVMAEAGNQSEEGKRLVIDVILNRVNSNLFPDTIEDVIFQKDPVQFAVTVNGALYKNEPTEDIMRLILEEVKKPMNTEILYFSAGKNANGKLWKKVGDHYFSTQK